MTDRLIVEVRVTPEMLAAAKEQENRIRRDRMAQGDPTGTLRNSFTNGEAMFEGMLGEQVVRHCLGAAYKEDSFHWDLNQFGLHLEVKTKRCTYRPSLNYLCSVSKKSYFQECYAYVFVRVTYDDSKAWILGAMTKEEFKKVNVFYKKGDIDPSSRNGWRFKEDCYNVEVRQLHPLNAVLQTV